MHNSVTVTIYETDYSSSLMPLCGDYSLFLKKGLGVSVNLTCNIVTIAPYCYRLL